jgi:hypothetical protein
MSLSPNASKVFTLVAAVGLVAATVVVAMAAPEAPQGTAAPADTVKPQPPINETIVTPTLQAKPDANGDEAKKKAEENALPFIRIDRKAKEVRIDGVICPRMETLELFACGNGVREHEAIVSVKARPRDVNVALIMLGDPPGHSATYTKDGQFLPPYGPVYRVFVEYQVEGKPKRVEAHHWLKDTSTGKPPKPMTWVFAGGEMRKGHFIPDYEGTVVCLSNFQAPILDVPFESSSKNTDLMYGANDAVIPAVGTAVTLILQATGETVGGKKLAWVLAIDKDGSMAVEGQKVTMEQLEQKLKDRDQYVQKVQIFIHPEAAGGLMLDAMGIVTKFGLEVELYKKAPLPEDLGGGKTDKKDEPAKAEPAKDAEGK